MNWHRNQGERQRLGTTGAWRRIRAAVLDRDGHRCQVCGSTQELEVHHVLPVAAGGTDDPSNLQTVCFDCHPRGRPPAA